MTPFSVAPRRVSAALGVAALAVVCLGTAATPRIGEAADAPQADAVAAPAPCRAPFDRAPVRVAAATDAEAGAPGADAAPPVCPPTVAGGGPPRRVLAAPAR